MGGARFAYTWGLGLVKRRLDEEGIPYAYLDGRTRDVEALLFQAPYKGGQIASLRLADLAAVEQLFCDTARGRAEFASIDHAQTERRVRGALAH